MSSSGLSVCPICRRPTDPRFRPFCSRRCADIDLGRWFRGDYRIPVSERERREGEDESGGA
ncbi:MAG: DNA gyrase inhibitor YacG [Acetobacteraceae bacterium]|nr:DNA gyrase inhibitor YacG [Acetobacteraceae bacterium]MBV8525738.1 DNA gyrase inhibitor YacG [Acetobacteraceae bacterium]